MTTAPTLSAPRARRRLRLPWRLLTGLSLLLLLVWFAPMLVAWSPVPQWAAGSALGKVRGSLHVGSLSLGWFSPVVVRDVELRDENQEAVATLPRVESSKTLLQILLDLNELGEFRCERPTLRVVFSGSQTNLERMAAPLTEPQPSTTSEGGSPGMSLVVEDARVEVRDDDSGMSWIVAPLSLAVAVPRDGLGALTAKIRGAIQGGPAAGTFDADVTMVLPAAGEAGMGSGIVTAHAADFPVDLITPVLRRFDRDGKLAGRLDARLDGKWDDRDNPSASIDGQVTLKGLTVAGQWSEGVALSLESVEAPCRANLRGRRVEVEQARLTCPIGQGSFRGIVDLQQGIGGCMSQPGVELTAEVDLPRLASLPPVARRLREATTFAEGRVTLRARSNAGTNGVVWEGDMRTTTLAGSSAGKPFRWENPVTATAAVRVPPGAMPVVEKLRCDSGFLQVDASGSAAEWTATARCDLDRLAAQLAMFVDLPPASLAGAMQAQLTLRPGADGSFEMEGGAGVAHLALAIPGAGRLQEPELRAGFRLAGHLGDSGPDRIDTCRCRVLCGTDELDVALLDGKPMRLSEPDAAVDVRLTGDLARWYARLAPWVPGTEYCQLGGSGEVAARVTLTPRVLGWQNAHVVARELRVVAPGVWIAEPTADLLASGSLDLVSGLAEARDLQWTSPSVSLTSPLLKAALYAEAGPTLDGTAQVQGDLGRIQQWIQNPSQPVSDLGSGKLAGQVVLQGDGPRQRAQLDLAVRDLIVGTAAAPTWREAEVHLLGGASYDLREDRLQLDRLQCLAPAMRGEVSGRIERATTTQELHLEGQLDYDLERLQPNLRTYVGDGVKIAGRDRKPFRVDGSLTKDGAVTFAVLQGDATAGWASAEAFGCQVGPADLKLLLGGGWLRLDPINTTCSQGHLHLEPSLRLEPGPMELYLGRGPVIDRAKITPAMCASAMRYAIPVLSGVAEADGEVSLELDAARVPLADTAKSDLAGRFTIHAARLTGSPLVRQLAAVVDRSAEVSLRKESVVHFRMLDGKVHHQGMELVFPDLTVRTQGYVGVDGSLMLIAEFPIPPKWVGSNKLTGALANQTVKLPITGTIDRPYLDPQALQAVSRQFLKESVRDAAINELDNRLQKLLKPKP